ncbi:metal-sensitive transcriptional regulator [Cellulomonas soli]|uniref:metal-sensitive transcriptional regulator n=1 Tax=Cellulomonas soli TaxID=931535 RepID=UPI003F82AE7C
MELDKDDTQAVAHRLRRAQGQLAAVVRMLDEGRDCEAVVTQLSAVSRALDRAGFALIAANMRQCLMPAAQGDPEAAAAGAGEPALDVRRLEKLFLSLA